MEILDSVPVAESKPLLVEPVLSAVSPEPRKEEKMAEPKLLTEIEPLPTETKLEEEPKMKTPPPRQKASVSKKPVWGKKSEE